MVPQNCCRFFSSLFWTVQLRPLICHSQAVTACTIHSRHLTHRHFTCTYHFVHEAFTRTVHLCFVLSNTHFLLLFFFNLLSTPCLTSGSMGPQIISCPLQTPLLLTPLRLQLQDQQLQYQHLRLHSMYAMSWIDCMQYALGVVAIISCMNFAFPTTNGQHSQRSTNTRHPVPPSYLSTTQCCTISLAIHVYTHTSYTWNFLCDYEATKHGRADGAAPEGGGRLREQASRGRHEQLNSAL